MRKVKIATLAAILLLLLGAKSTNGQPANLFTGKTVSSNELAIASNVNDGDVLTQFKSELPYEVGEYIQIDLGTQQSVQTIGMVQSQTGDATYINVYVGDTPASDLTYQTANTLCYSGFREGLAACVGFGQYVIFTSTVAGAALQFAELYAWDALFADVAVSNVQHTFASISTFSPSSTFTDVFGTKDGTHDRCIQLSMQQEVASLTFDLAEQTTVDYLWVYIGHSTGINVDYIDVSVIDASLAETFCQRMVFSATGDRMQFCACNGLDAVRIKFEYESTELLSSALESICRVGIFGQACSSIAPTITEDPFTGGTTNFDLLADTQMQITLPTFTTEPACYTYTWQVLRVSDNTDMAVAAPSTFTVSAPDLILSNTVTDFTERLSLFGTVSYFFIATLSDTGLTQTSQFSFIINFTDDCRGATVQSQAITYPPVKWNVDLISQMQVPAFTDSVDTTGTYTAGICGEKTFILDSGLPAFLSITVGAVDPVLDPFTINYDQSLATEADIGQNIIVTTVTLKEYAGVTMERKGWFAFEIECPDFVVSSTLDSQLSPGPHQYDLASGTTLSLVAPVVSLHPANCFTVSTYLVKEEATGHVPSYVFATVSTVDILTNDRAFKGMRQLEIAAVVLESQEELQKQTFDVEITDSCDFTEIVDNVSLETITALAQSVETVRVSYPIYTDSVSNNLGNVGACGPIVMTLSQSSPSFVNISNTGGASTFEIVVNPSDQLVSSTALVGIVIGLANYPEVLELYTEVKIVIEDDFLDLNGLPAFAEGLSTKELSVSEKTSWQLPDIIEGDYTLDSVMIEPAWQIESLIQFDQSTLTLTFIGSVGLGPNITFRSIVITLIDVQGGTRSYTQTLKINPSSVQEAEEQTPPEIDTIGNALAGSNLTGEGKDDQSGGTGSGFEAREKESKTLRDRLAQRTKKAQILPLAVTSLGQISLGFEPQGVLVPHLWETGEIDDELLTQLATFRFAQNSFEEPQIRFEAEITSFNSTGIEIQAKFSQPLLVSQGRDSPDQVEISLHTEFFTTLEATENFVPFGELLSESNAKNVTHVTLVVDIPKQVGSEKEILKLWGVGESLSDLMTTQFYFSIGVSLLLKGILGQMWSMLNTLQLLTSLSTMAVIMPQNVLEIQQFTIDIVFSKLVPKEALSDIFDWGPKDSFQKGLVQLVIVVPLIVILIALVYLGKRMCCCALGRTIMTKIEAKLVINSLLRVSLQTFLAVFLSLTFSLKMTDMSTKTGTADLFLALLILAYSLALTIFSLKFMQRRFNELSVPTFRSRFGSFYTNVNTYDKRAILFTFYFLLRRMLFVANLTFCDFSIVLQVFCADTLSTCILGFYLSVRPMNGLLTNLTEIVNEIAVLSSVQLMFVFTDYVGDPVQRYAFGYYFMYYVGAVICINLMAFVISAINSAILAVRRFFTKRRIRAKTAVLKAEKQGRREQHVLAEAKKAAASGPTHQERQSRRQKIDLALPLPSGELPSKENSQVKVVKSDMERPLDSEGEIIYSLRSDGPPLQSQEELPLEEEQVPKLAKLETSPITDSKTMIEMTVIKVGRVPELDGESQFSDSASDNIQSPGSKFKNNDPKPITKSYFMSVFGFDPTVQKQGLSESEFLQEHGYNPTSPRGHLSIQTVPIIVKDGQSFYLV